MSSLLQKQIDNLNKILQNLIERSIPKVGDIELNFSGTNPQEKYPGTKWRQCAQGRALVGVGSNGENMYETRQEFGADKHKLDINEIPAHKHKLDGNVIVYSPNNPELIGGGKYRWGGRADQWTASAGGNGFHENRQSSIALYVWERTA